MSRELALQEIAQWLSSLFYVVHQQLVSGKSQLYTVIVDTISLSQLSKYTCRLGVVRAVCGISVEIINVPHFPPCWR